MCDDKAMIRITTRLRHQVTTTIVKAIIHPHIRTARMDKATATWGLMSRLAIAEREVTQLSLTTAEALATTAQVSTLFWLRIS